MYHSLLSFSFSTRSSAAFYLYLPLLVKICIMQRFAGVREAWKVESGNRQQCSRFSPFQVCTPCISANNAHTYERTPLALFFIIKHNKNLHSTSLVVLYGGPCGLRIAKSHYATRRATPERER